MVATTKDYLYTKLNSMDLNGLECLKQASSKGHKFDKIY